MRSALGWCGQVLAWLVILTTAAVLAVAVVVPRIAGATPYTVLTGSMRPGLPPGTLVVVRPRPMSSIGVGSVITYQVRSGDPTVVTHRVVAQGYDVTGQPVLRTRGEANGALDEELVRPVQVRGEVWYAVPKLGYLSVLLTGAQRQLVTTLAAAGLIGYAAAMFVGAFRDRRRGGRVPARRRAVRP